MSEVPQMAFVDMETTGLDASLDVPLELGIVLTDNFGHTLGACKWLIWEEDDKAFQAGVTRGYRNEFVNEMHIKSGLWKDIDMFECFSRDEADELAVKFLESRGCKPGVLGMTGNSIGSLDRPFALQHFPKLDKFLGYRNIDMSSLKELVKRVNPGLYANLKPIIEDKEAAVHRVLEDCYAAIKEYQCYLDEFLIVGD